MTIDRSELRRLAEAATPNLDKIIVEFTGRDDFSVFTNKGDSCADFAKRTDANLFIVARPSILALLDELERRDALSIQKMIKDMQSDYLAAKAEAARAHSEGMIVGLRRAVGMATAAHDRCMNKAGF
jgi:hypothetical protein